MQKEKKIGNWGTCPNQDYLQKELVGLWTTRKNSLSNRRQREGEKAIGGSTFGNGTLI